jgi:hypothetical protein
MRRPSAGLAGRENERRHVEQDAPVRQNEGLQRCFRFLEKADELAVIEQPAKRPHAGTLGGDQRCNGFEVDLASVLRDSRIGYSGFARNFEQPPGIAEREGGPESVADGFAKEPIQ